VPDWVLKATRLGIDNEEETGTAEGALLSFKGVPLLPIPYLSFPLVGQAQVRVFAADGGTG
jgi:LPS-assembly protein